MNVLKIAQGDRYLPGFLLEKNFFGGDNRSLFFKQHAIVSIVLSIVLTILGGKRLLVGQKSFGGGGGAPPAPPCSRKPV